MSVELIDTKPGFGGDDARVVDVADRPQLEGRVVVEEAVQPVGAEGEGADGLGPVEVLADAVDDAGLDEVDDAVGQQLGVDAEVAMVGEGGEDGVRGGADADLDRGAVGDAFGDVGGDAGVELVASPPAISMSGRSTSHQPSTCDTWSWLRPNVRGIRG